MGARKVLLFAAAGFMAITMILIPLSGNQAHAGPEPDGSIKGQPVGIMGTVTDKVNMNQKRAEAAKRLKERRAAAIAAKKANSGKKDLSGKGQEGGAK